MISLGGKYPNLSVSLGNGLRMMVMCRYRIMRTVKDDSENAKRVLGTKKISELLWFV